MRVSGAGLPLAVAGDPHLDLVDPEHRRRHRLDGLERPVEHPLRRALHAGEHQVHVEAEQRELPLDRDDLDRERLSAAGHAHHQHALGARQALR